MRDDDVLAEPPPYVEEEYSRCFTGGDVYARVIFFISGRSGGERREIAGLLACCCACVTRDYHTAYAGGVAAPGRENCTPTMNL